VRQFGANYRVPLYRLGGGAGASYTRSTVVGDFGALKSTGAGQTMGVNYSHYLPPDGRLPQLRHAGAGRQAFRHHRDRGMPVPGQQVRRSRPLTLGTRRGWRATHRPGVTARAGSQPGPAGSGNNLSAYQSEDPRINTAAFRVVRANANYLATLGGGWLWSARGQFQYSPDALISGEQFGLGGATSIRGTSERPISGDKGLMAAWR
jgi:hemolysin activation/secretion protein